MVLSAVRPIRVMLREMQPSAKRWTTILSLEATGRRDRRELEAGITLSEGSLMQLRIVPDRLQDFHARFYVCNALVASTLERDRPDFLLELLPDPETGEDYFVCRGHMFRDWAGTTELEVRVQEGDNWLPVVFAGV